jgi:hypothetical protein
VSEVQLYKGDGFDVARVAGVRNRNGVQRGAYVIREHAMGGSVKLTMEQWSELATWLNPRGVKI